ncbi:MAG: hypothetical protein MK184_06920 [Acidimicrobiales bacterium]|nr:hypothetical protein [Acidimicrobiales bacterium]
MPVEAVRLDLASTVSHAGWNARLHRLADPRRRHRRPSLSRAFWGAVAVLAGAALVVW